MSDTREYLVKPELHASVDTGALWNDPHVSQSMIEFHLDDSHDLASRRTEQRASTVAWIIKTIPVNGLRITDLGCGPGLYAKLFAEAGATVTGMDLNKHSIAYARENTPEATFQVGNYLLDPIPEADLITLIFADIGAMLPTQRKSFLRRVFDALSDGGRFVVDNYSPAAFNPQEEVITRVHAEGGFWALGPHTEEQIIFAYPEAKTNLNRFVITEDDGRTRVVNTWMQATEPHELKAELLEAGFAEVSSPIEVITGAAWKEGDLAFALIASKQ
ncbi:class I SAM-dependent methyltransferase [uncultured Tateyamaria sp.]|uniref:class I SAM-dependent methyltransferase n=1 Tax=uncultured Tateyamaria sp. TaxID=455651 RepID=UPI0026288157|nr:class I SAM-dependent methyltransferase [uncultured Tateyamaria sp.]